jgi:hypothetical protein
VTFCSRLYDGARNTYRVHGLWRVQLWIPYEAEKPVANRIENHSCGHLHIDGALFEALLDWSRRIEYKEADDWVFASPEMKGKQPYWPETLTKCHGNPLRGV